MGKRLSHVFWGPLAIRAQLMWYLERVIYLFAHPRLIWLLLAVLSSSWGISVILPGFNHYPAFEKSTIVFCWKLHASFWKAGSMQLKDENAPFVLFAVLLLFCSYPGSKTSMHPSFSCAGHARRPFQVLTCHARGGQPPLRWLMEIAPRVPFVSCLISTPDLAWHTVSCSDLGRRWPKHESRTISQDESNDIGLISVWSCLLKITSHFSVAHSLDFWSIVLSPRDSKFGMPLGD